MAQTPTRPSAGPYCVVEGGTGAFVLDTYAGIVAQCLNKETADELADTLNTLKNRISILAQGGRPPVD